MRGSITASTALALPILWVASGHHVPIFAVNTRHATSGGALTLTTFRTLFASLAPDFVCSVIVVSFLSMLLAQRYPQTRPVRHPRSYRASGAAPRCRAR